MLNIFSWLLHGEDVGLRLLIMAGSGASYVTGAGWHPETPEWIAGGLGVLVAASLSRPADKAVGGKQP